jgi:hypothetical protein
MTLFFCSGMNDVCAFCPMAGGPSSGANATTYLFEMSEILTSIAAAPVFHRTIVTIIPPVNVSLQLQFTDVQCALFLPNGGCAIQIDICAASRSLSCPCLETPTKHAELAANLAAIVSGLPDVVAAGSGFANSKKFSINLVLVVLQQLLYYVYCCECW